MSLFGWIIFGVIILVCGFIVRDKIVNHTDYKNGVDY